MQISSNATEKLELIMLLPQTHLTFRNVSSLYRAWVRTAPGGSNVGLVCGDVVAVTGLNPNIAAGAPFTNMFK